MTVTEQVKEPFKKTEKQVNAINLMKAFIYVLLEGGARSGKTFIIIYVIFVRALKHPGSDHLCVRKHFNHIKARLWLKTIPDVIRIAFPNLQYTLNSSDWYVELSNGSRIWIAGTDTNERIEKILGSEWATIFLNEVSEQTYEVYELLKTRLNPPKGVKPLFILDQNPPKKSFWSYTQFHGELDYETKQPLSDSVKASQCVYHMNPADNTENLNEAYMGILESMSERRKKRFLYGEYGDDTEGALWKSQWISSKRIQYKPENMHRVIVAIDPNVTDDKKVNPNTDEAGIITVGEYRIDKEYHYVVIRDDSTPGLSWGSVAVSVYESEKADKIIAEVNNGGDLVEKHLRNTNPNIAYDDVRASRGKAIRAEPVAELYEKGRVHHLGEFPDLEDELTTWVPGDTRSPNRLDALVWAISYLSGNTQGFTLKHSGI